MATEVKRPVRPFRRKSDIPLAADRFIEEESQSQRCSEMEIVSDKSSANPEASEKSTTESVANDHLDDCSLKIVESDSVAEPVVRSAELFSDCQKVTPVSRPVRPKARHKTLASQFPMLELQEKNEKEETGEQEGRGDLHLLTESHISAVNSESFSSSKPVVKPKPVLPSLRQQSANHANPNIHSSGLIDNNGPVVVSQKSGFQKNSEPERHEDGIRQHQDNNDKRNMIEKSRDQQVTDQVRDSTQLDTGQVISVDQNQCISQLDEASQLESLQKNASKSNVVKEYSSHSSHEMSKDGETARQEDALDLTVDKEESPLSLQLSSAFPENCIEIPVYAKVDRTRKLKNATSCDSGVASSSHLKTDSESVTKSSDLVNSGASPLDTNVNPIPPKKPPRTFAHTEYLRLKTDKNEHCSGRPTATAAAESVYEEIEQLTLRNERSAAANSDKRSNRISFCQADSAESAKSDPIKRRSTGDKLPAPPRPPPPSIVQRTGTLPLRKDRESSPGFEAFQRGAANFRNSDRGFWDRRKSKSPDAPPRDKKSGEKKQKTKQLTTVTIEKLPFHGKVEEGIYADPDTLTNATSAPGSADSPVEDPLYEVPHLARKQPASSAATNAGVLLFPDAPKQPLRQAPVPTAAMTGSLQASRTGSDAKSGDLGRKNIQPMHAKISSAYSILRLNIESTDSSQSTNEAVEEDSDAEVTKDEQERRLKHISNVRKRTSNHVANYARMKLKEPNQLFHFALIVGLQLDENKKCHPTISFQYPEQLSDNVSADRVEHFCFPDAEIWRPVTIYDGEMFSFVLTNQLGIRQYGYCRRLLPSGNGNRLPAALCIVSSVSEACMYEQLLRTVEERFMASEEQAQDLLRAAYSHLCPDPNREIFIVTGPDCKKQPLIIRRSGETHPDIVSCDSLLTHLSTSTLIKVFGSILLERHLIFCAQKLSSLTSCIHTILSLLYPFEWQHVFIPVLPGCMTEILDSPAPYVIGIMSSTYAKLLQNDALSSEILVVDLDGGFLLRCYGDEEHIIPEKLQKALSTALKDDSDSVGVRDASVTEAFLRFFIETCGHYTDFITAHQDNKLEFDVDQFTSAVASRSIQMFLEWFVRTQMFDVFMTEELYGMKHDHFLARIMEYREEMTEMTSSLKQNMKMMRKKIKHFFVESGGKLRRKFRRNVFI